MQNTSVKGLIIPDLPHEQESFIKPYLENLDLALVPLVSLTTGLERQKELIEDARGFVYCCCYCNWLLETGIIVMISDKHLKHLTEIAQIPVLTGFGVSTLADIKRFNQVSDGVIVGSKIVKGLHEGMQEEIKDFIYAGSHYQK